MEVLDDKYFDEDIFVPDSKRMYNDGAYFGGTALIGLGISSHIYTYTEGGLYYFLYFFLIGFSLILIGLHLIFSKSGVKIDTRNNKIKYFVKYFNLIEIGTWEANKFYEQISILSKRESYQYSSAMPFVNHKSMVRDASKAVVVILDKTNLRKLEIFETKKISEAKFVAETLSEKTGFPIVVFNPIKLSKRR